MSPSSRQFPLNASASSSPSVMPHTPRDYYRFASSSSSSSASHHQERGPSSSSRSEYWKTVLESSPPLRQSEAPLPTISKTATRECPSCHRSIPARSYDDHVRTCSSSSDKPYACEVCGTAFKKNSNLVKHMKLVHLGVRNFACPEPGCGRLFGQKSNLNSHIKAVHLGEKPFICEEPGCGRRFSQKSGLKAHIKTVHHKERPYVCEECHASFGHRGDLNRHIRVLHEQQRPFTCPICPEPRAFGRKSVLLRHMQTHQSSRTRDAS